MRSWLQWFTAVPQPLKAFAWLYFAAFVVAIVGGFVFRVTWALAPLGISAVLFGLTLATNVNGSANAFAELAKTQRPWGVDYSKSFMATTGYMRFFGFFMSVIGVFMAVSSFTQG